MGPDVILAQHLTKNNVQISQYLLVTDYAYNDIKAPEGKVAYEGSETYPSFPQITVHVYDAKKQIAKPQKAILSKWLQHATLAKSSVASLFSDMQWRHIR